MIISRQEQKRLTGTYVIKKESSPFACLAADIASFYSMEGLIMLVTSKELFKKAQEKHFAIPAANFIDLESLKWHVEVAEKLGFPLILALAESHLGEDINLEDAALVGKKYAEAASVPVVLHLDHGATR